MTGPAGELLAAIRAELAPAEDTNRLVPLVASGRAPRAALAALAGEEQRIIPSDRRSFLVLAARVADSAAGDFFAALAHGESLAAGTLPAFAAAAGMDDEALLAYQPRAGCQAYPAYVAWLALNAEPADAALALVANFAAWGNYCAALATALRREYGYSEEACAFVDFFAAPTAELEEQALAVAAERLASGNSLGHARRYGRLLQSYELMFWNTLADVADGSEAAG